MTEAALWEKGNQADKLERHLQDSFQAYLDGEAIPITPEESFISSGVLYGEFDSKGNALGSHGGEMSTCLHADLTRGIHLASIEVTSLSGTRYTYSWAFNITSTDTYDYAATAQDASDTMEATIAAESTLVQSSLNALDKTPTATK